MDTKDLKAGLITFPAPQWVNGLDINQFSKSQIILTLSEILQEFGKFPVSWSASGIHAGFFVEGSDDRYIGSWMTTEHIDKNDGSAVVSEACEDLGDAELASTVIFGACFSRLFAPSSDVEVNDSNG